MATRLDDLSRHYDPDLYLPIDGAIYQIKAPSIAEVERVRPLIWTAQASEFGPYEEWRECVKILGAAFFEMLANEVPAPYVNHAGRTALIHFCSGPQGPELGRAHWIFTGIGERLDMVKMLEHLAYKVERENNEKAARAAMKKADG
ncbi:tail assembly chaperone [Gordonia phage Sahara]|uniref:Tail assembly chaperone n=1 Tax=Gordonia phage Sahara TaxID=2859488 RepID=A0AAE8BKQ1_9CAUD|nr:tail assembly chaperone [Gordonia phage Sahara]QYW00745.1 tail assembly chaperone [Gordonia phage Sahara]